MDTSNPAAFVNGELLRMYIGKKVRTVIQIIHSENELVHGKSADGQQVLVKGSPPSFLTPFVEVIGTAESAQSINVEQWNNFGETFGKLSPDFSFSKLQSAVQTGKWRIQAVVSMRLDYNKI